MPRLAQLLQPDVKGGLVAVRDEVGAGAIERRNDGATAGAELVARLGESLGERATLLQVGSPFDYERQMKLFVANKMPDPRDAVVALLHRHGMELAR